MSNETSVPGDSMNDSESSDVKSGRLYYLDWLRVILIFGVFMFHVLHPFDAELDWHIKNAERSGAITGILLLIGPWGIPLFFLVAGAGSKFALRRRNSQQYIRERVNRLLIPFIVGTILLSSFQRYLEALHFENFQGSFLSFIPEWLSRSTTGIRFSPAEFGDWGLHLWFLAFLFAFSLFGLPFFNWFKKEAGQSFISGLGSLVEKRGGILLFILPLALARILIFPIDPNPNAHGWLDFVYFFLFFLLGYIIYSDERFVSAIRRDRWLLFAAGVLGLASYFGLTAVKGDIVFEWAQSFVMPWSIILIFSFTFMSWGWAIDGLYLAMKYLNFSNKWLEYGNETIMPFYLLHQPVIIVISYFVVQWDAGILVKLLVVIVGSLLITLGLIRLLIWPFKPIRRLFGMKSRKPKEAKPNTSPA
jgi:glucan biosynthesis protein C